MWKKEDIVSHILGSIETQEQAIIAAWNAKTEVPTRHAVIENLLPIEVCREAYGSFPENAEEFYHIDSFRERKHTTTKLDNYSLLREITEALNDPRVVAKIGELTSMPTMVADESLYASGLSMMLKGDFLNPHIDNSHNASRNMYRRINLLYYLNPNWSLEKGGNLELWTKKRDIPLTIVSSENRLVLMETHGTSYHSVSPILSDDPRCCVSVYYFSPDSPSGQEYFHITAFYGRPEELAKRAISHIDNALRTIAAKVFKMGRGKDRVYKKTASST